MRAWVMMAAVVGMGAMAAPVAGQRAAGAAGGVSRGEIERLVRELGDPRWQVREAATGRLVEIGEPAAEALRGAMMGADLEVKARCRMLLEDRPRLVRERLAGLRVKVLEAFGKADYATAVGLSRQATGIKEAGMLDWLWLGHSCQLRGDWAGAVEGYRKVVTFIDKDLQLGAKSHTAPPDKEPGGPRDGDGERVGPGIGGNLVGPVGPRGPQLLSDRERTELVRQRTLLLHWIARMQRSELKAPAQAAKTLGEALDYLAADKTAMDDGWQSIAMADEIPLCLHEAGDLAGAVEGWKRTAAWRDKLDRRRRTDTAIVDVDRIFAGMRALGPGARAPEVPWIVTLDPAGGGTKLDFDNEPTRQRAYKQGVYSHYALAPPAGQEFASIEFACDIEQADPRLGGHFRCRVAGTEPAGFQKDLGSIGWPRGRGGKDPVGRRTVKGAFAIPPGAGLVHIQIGTPRNKEFTVHSVVARPVCRPIRRNAPPICGDAWAQMKLYPPTGRLTWGAMELRNETAVSGLTPGRDTLRFAVPGDARTIETPFEVRPGRRYGLFVNLDSPFRWRQADLDLGSGRGASDSGLSVQRVGNEFLAVWCTHDGKLQSARSGDLVRWSRSETLPISSVFTNAAPGTFRGADGVVWLAYFSNRLSPLNGTTGGYQLWLTSTPDGKAWSPPRKIDVQSVTGWPLDPPVMLADQARRKWLFGRGFAGCVDAPDSLDALGELKPLTAAKLGEKELNLWRFQVVPEGQAGFRMVFDNCGEGIYTMTSGDGLAWENPRLLVAPETPAPGRYAGDLTHPRLVPGNGRTMLLYCNREAGFLTPLDLAGPPVSAGQGVRISNHLVSIAGRTPVLHEGKVFLIAGESTTWLLEAEPKALSAVPATKPGPP